ncbi:MAG: carotenoid oxygenase family protein [Gammaproteobacteria bacterium]|nr:carotenoid oxygenase family protein [Gammaproteobacteria bacterium]
MTNGAKASTAQALPLASRNIAVLSREGLPPPDAPKWIWDVDHPYLHGIFAPVDSEYEADGLDIEGELPADLEGCYVMNSPNQRHQPPGRYHYYDGDGMLHALYLRNGTAVYKRRWVNTLAFEHEAKAGEAVWPGLAGPFNFDLPGGPIKDNSNTDIIFFGGRMLSLWYLAGVPYRIDPHTLQTVGPEDFGGAMPAKLSAHSKVDPVSGELIFFDYGNEPVMTYGVAEPNGQLVHQVDIPLPGPRSPHDIGITENYAVLHDLPMFQDAEVLKKHGKRIVRFHPDVPARFGVIPRRDNPEDIRWFEAEPCYLLHVVNTFEDGEWVVMDGCRQANPIVDPDPNDGELAKMLAFRRRVHALYRWRFNLRTGEVREQQIDDLNTEFPRVNPLRVGRPSRFAYHQYLPLPEDGTLTGRCQTFDALVKYDTDTGAYQRYDYGPGVYGNETPFAPRTGAGATAGEDDGYLVTFSTDTKDWSSHALIFDATDITRGPICRIRIPVRIPLGFHANWIAGTQLWADG